MLRGRMEGSVWVPDASQGIYLLRSCPAGHQLVNTSLGVFSHANQRCEPCTAGLEYIVDPNRHACTKCPPAGAVCDGASLAGRVPGSIWVPDHDSGIWRLVSCPSGHALVNSTDGTSRGVFSHDAQTCRECVVGLEYNLDPNRHPCHPCPTTGASCDGSTLTSLVPGATWSAGPAGEVLRLQLCPAGYILVVAADARDDACVLCPAGTYSLLPASMNSGLVAPSTLVAASGGLCNPCPRGATCSGGKDVVPRKGYWFKPAEMRGRRAAADDGQAVVLRCPPGACLEGGECGEGREGPVCALCADGACLPGYSEG